MNYIEYLAEGGITKLSDLQYVLLKPPPHGLGVAKIATDDYNAYGKLYRDLVDFIKKTWHNNVQDNSKSLAFTKGDRGYYVSVAANNDNNYTDGLDPQSNTIAVVNSVK